MSIHSFPLLQHPRACDQLGSRFHQKNTLERRSHILLDTPFDSHTIYANNYSPYDSHTLLSRTTQNNSLGSRYSARTLNPMNHIPTTAMYLDRSEKNGQKCVNLHVMLKQDRSLNERHSDRNWYLSDITLTELRLLCTTRRQKSSHNAAIELMDCSVILQKKYKGRKKTTLVLDCPLNGTRYFIQAYKKQKEDAVSELHENICARIRSKNDFNCTPLLIRDCTTLGTSQLGDYCDSSTEFASPPQDYHSIHLMSPSCLEMDMLAPVPKERKGYSGSYDQAQPVIYNYGYVAHEDVSMITSPVYKDNVDNFKTGPVSPINEYFSPIGLSPTADYFSPALDRVFFEPTSFQRHDSIFVPKSKSSLSTVAQDIQSGGIPLLLHDYCDSSSSTIFESTAICELVAPPTNSPMTPYTGQKIEATPISPLEWSQDTLHNKSQEVPRECPINNDEHELVDETFEFVPCLSRTFIEETTEETNQSKQFAPTKDILGELQQEIFARKLRKVESSQVHTTEILRKEPTESQPQSQVVKPKKQIPTALPEIQKDKNLIQELAYKPQVFPKPPAQSIIKSHLFIEAEPISKISHNNPQESLLSSNPNTTSLNELEMVIEKMKIKRQLRISNLNSR